MQFESFSAFLDMGGYAFFVWLSYGVSTLLLALLVYTSHRSHTQVKNKIVQRLQREKKLRKAAQKQIDQENSPVENQSKNPNEAI